MARIRPPKIEQKPVEIARIEAEVAAIEKPKARVYTRAESEQQQQLVLEWRIDGFARSTIWKQLRARWPGLGRKRLEMLWERVNVAFATQADRPLVAKKEEALARLRRIAVTAIVGEWDEKRKAWKHKPDLKAAIRAEEAIARIEGTEAPIQVQNTNVHLTAAMVAVVGKLTKEDAADYLAEALEQGRLAEIARKELPALVVESRNDGSGVSVEPDAEE